MWNSRIWRPDEGRKRALRPKRVKIVAMAVAIRGKAGRSEKGRVRVEEEGVAGLGGMVGVKSRD